MMMKGRDDDSGTAARLQFRAVVALFGLVALPVVWISLYFVVTTGGGLPAGPWGLLGATEGLSYLAIVGFSVWVLIKAITKSTTETRRSDEEESLLLDIVERLSFLSLLAGLLALASLVVEQGCVPNAKPILDYSSYLPVCEAEQAPGIFGGS